MVVKSTGGQRKRCQKITTPCNVIQAGELAPPPFSITTKEAIMLDREWKIFC